MFLNPNECSPLTEPLTGHRQQSNRSRLDERHSPLRLLSGAGACVLFIFFCGVADAQGNSTTQLRDFISRQVGGLKNLRVPATDADIPLPTQPDGTVAYRYQTTEAKRFLGKMLFHDPVRTARIDINQGQPVDLPAGTAFGGTVSASDPNIQAIVNATKQTGSCGSCHIGEAAGKAGQLLNFNVGGEGRGYTDENGNFFPRRRPQSILTKQRTEPIFPGDMLVDALPTLTDIDCISGQPAGAANSYVCMAGQGQPVVTTPAPFYHTPAPDALLATGRLDELDSVGRQSPGMIGFAFNNRLLFGGFAGEPQSTPGSLNPLSDPAQENLTLLLLDAHRMLNFQSAELLKIPAFIKLFQDAFPTEAAQAAAAKDMTLLVSDDTVLRATATFLRTVVTRNTPFDRFLAGDDRALTAAQQRGAQLFFTPAAGGAGCSSCHSGPMLNKQPDDPDVAGIGAYVEENFFNVGIGDHPVQALNALARGHLDPNTLGADGFPYHAEDVGRQEVTHDPNDAFEFRALTLRQLKDARSFFHNGSFTKLRDVVEYFNAGVPQDLTAGASPTLSARFTNPRGPGYPNGLGLTEQQVDDLTDFLENALYDPALVNYDPASGIDTLQPNEHDLTYSIYRPDLAALGAKDGFMLSGLAIDDNDPLARRDEGLEFLDVTSQLRVKTATSLLPDGLQIDEIRITNVDPSPVDTHLLIIVRGLSVQASLENASGMTSSGDPYIRVFLKDGVLQPDASIRQQLIFTSQGGDGAAPVAYVLDFMSGQGNP
jgi:cytochrome c peroxidase